MDASNVRVGAVLSQEGPDGEKIVAYFNRVFNKSERCYCVTRCELLVVVMAVRHFKYYLCATPFNKDRPCCAPMVDVLELQAP